MIDSILSITSDEATAYFQARRWRATATTWFRKTAAALRWQYDRTASPETRYLVAEEASRLLYDALSDALQLVPLLSDETMHDLEMVEREAQAIVKAIRGVRLAAKMDNTTGRTPEEAAAFARKAEELRR